MWRFERVITTLTTLAVAVTPLAAACGRSAAAPAPAPAGHAQTPSGGGVGDPAEWCGGHGLPESMCPKCNVGIAERFQEQGDWCAEHGYPESVCPTCNPMRPPGASPVGSSSTPTPPPAEGRRLAGAGGTAHGHATEEESCLLCDASKRDAGRLWCTEHGRYEDRCWECQPQLRDPDRPYCDEHGLYEDECVLCDPSRAPRDGVRRVGAPEVELFCHEHGVPERQCGICQPQLAGGLAAGESLLVRLPSSRSADLAGLTVAQPTRADAVASLPLLGELRFDGNRLARLTPLSGGVLTAIHADVGQVVEAGETLAVVNAPGVAAAKAGYLSARAEQKMRSSAAKRQRRLVEQRTAARRAQEEAEAAHRKAQVATALARQGLLNLGFEESELSALRTSDSSLALRAPFAGTVVSRTAVLGEAVDTGDTLFEIADLGEMWVDLWAPEEHAARIRVGTPLRAAVRALPETSVEGRITWVSPVVDPRTRLVLARGAVPNDDGALRQGMFAEVSAILEAHPDAIVLPSSAVHRVDEAPFVFVRVEPDLFAARRVDIGDRTAAGEVPVFRGILSDDAVVMRGGFAIKSALLASRLGAGCTDD